MPVPGNWFGDGIRLAVFHRCPDDSAGKWFIKGPGMASWGESEGNVILDCGVAGDVPIIPNEAHWPVMACVFGKGVPLI